MVNTVVGISVLGGVAGAYAGYVVGGAEVASGLTGVLGGLIVADAVATGAIGGLVIGGAVAVVVVGVAVGGYYGYQYLNEYLRTKSGRNIVTKSMCTTDGHA